MSKFYKDHEERLEYNETISDVPDHINNLTFVGEMGIITRLYKLAEHATNKSGFVDFKQKVHVGESGRAKAELDPELYQKRGVVIAVSPEATEYMKKNWSQEPLKKGDIYWPHPAQVSASRKFVQKVDVAVANDEGYFSFHPNHVIAIESRA
jgi:hypothetical protein